MWQTSSGFCSVVVITSALLTRKVSGSILVGNRLDRPLPHFLFHFFSFLSLSRVTFVINWHSRRQSSTGLIAKAKNVLGSVKHPLGGAYP